METRDFRKYPAGHRSKRYGHKEIHCRFRCYGLRQGRETREKQTLLRELLNQKYRIQVSMFLLRFQTLDLKNLEVKPKNFLKLLKAIKEAQELQL